MVGNIAGSMGEGFPNSCVNLVYWPTVWVTARVSCRRLACIDCGLHGRHGVQKKSANLLADRNGHGRLVISAVVAPAHRVDFKSRGTSNLAGSHLVRHTRRYRSLHLDSSPGFPKNAINTCHNNRLPGHHHAAPSSLPTGGELFRPHPTLPTAPTDDATGCRSASSNPVPARWAEGHLRMARRRLPEGHPTHPP